MPIRTLRAVFSEVCEEMGDRSQDIEEKFKLADASAGKALAEQMDTTEVADEEYEPFKVHIRDILTRINAGTIEWGLYDTVENCWMGDAKGPVRYKDIKLGRISERVINKQFGTIDRYELRPITDEVFTHRDTVEAKMTGLEAIRKIEGFNDGS